VLCEYKLFSPARESEVKNYLSDLLGVKVDLVLKKALKPHIGERILQEVIMI
jgi:predicted nucleotidyltransferase